MSERKTLTIEVSINDPWKVMESESHFLALSSPDENWRARIKKDGCFEFFQRFNGDEEDMDQMHICDVDQLIIRLVALRDEAKKHFGERWPHL